MRDTITIIPSVEQDAKKTQKYLAENRNLLKSADQIAARRHYQLINLLLSIDSHLESIADNIALLSIEKTNP